MGILFYTIGVIGGQAVENILARKEVEGHFTLIRDMVRRMGVDIDSTGNVVTTSDSLIKSG